MGLSLLVPYSKSYFPKSSLFFGFGWVAGPPPPMDRHIPEPDPNCDPGGGSLCLVAPVLSGYSVVTQRLLSGYSVVTQRLLSGDSAVTQW